MTSNIESGVPEVLALVVANLCDNALTIEVDDLLAASA